MTARRPPGNANRFPRSSGVIARLAYGYAESVGIAVRPLLRKSGITYLQIHHRESSLKARDQIEFLALVAQGVDDDLLGFHLAQRCELREGGLFYYVIASSETLLDALQRGTRYSAIVNEGIAPTCVEGAEIGVRFRYSGISRHRDRHQIEFWVTALVRALRVLTGVRLVPAHVRLAHVREHGLSEMTRFFGCDVEFGAAVDEVTFARRLRHMPMRNGDPYLGRLLITFCEEAVSNRRAGFDSVRSQVENAIAPLLPHGNARLDRVARRIGLSQRSLARHLAREGLSFSRVLNRLRLELARHYLTQERLPVSKVGWLIGYQNVAAFSHAFKRWTGKAPSVATGRRES